MRQEMRTIQTKDDGINRQSVGYRRGYKEGRENGFEAGKEAGYEKCERLVKKKLGLPADSIIDPMFEIEKAIMRLNELERKERG